MSHRKVTYLLDNEDRYACYEKSARITQELKRADIPLISTARYHRYYDIDSAFRNRTIYPNPADFVINTSNLPKGGVSVAQAEDPISLGIPLVTGELPAQTPPPTGFPTPTDLIIQLPNQYTGGLPAPYMYYNIPNYYAGWYLGIATDINSLPEFRQISSYSNTYQQATISSPFSSAPVGGEIFTLRKQLPIFSGTVGTSLPIPEIIVSPAETIPAIPATPHTMYVKLIGSPSNVNGTYVGNYIYIANQTNGGVNNGGSVKGYFSLIVAYDGANNIATLATPLAVTPTVGEPVYITQYTRDNSGTLVHNSVFGNNPTCHNVSLIYLSIPNLPIANILSNGASILVYPYIYIRFENDTNSSTADGLISSNNSKAYYALFKIPVPNCHPSETFIHFRDSRMNQTIKFRGDQPIRFTVMLPNGEPIRYIAQDTLSPFEPNPFLQVSATFQIDKIE